MSAATKTKPMTKREMRVLHARACAAAQEAWLGATPTPMIVGTPTNMMDSLMGGDGGGHDPSKPIYRVAHGVCGIAWVSIRPGNSRFANFLRSEGIGSTDSYEGGLRIPGFKLLDGIDCGPAVQSYERNSAAVGAYAAVIREATGLTVYGLSRLD